MGSKNIREGWSYYGRAVLLEAGEEIVLDELADRGSLIWVFMQTDHHEVLCCFGDHYFV